MNHLKTYKIFEVRFELPSEEVFQDIADTLQTEIFDEYDIPFMSEEEEDELYEKGLEEDSKRWEWSYKGSSNIQGIEVNYEGAMCQINILYITRKELQEIYKKIKEEVNPILKGRTGWQLDMSHDYCDDPTIDKDHLILKPVR